MCFCDERIRAPYCDSEECKRVKKLHSNIKQCDKCGNFYSKKEIVFNIGADMAMCEPCNANHEIFYLKKEKYELEDEINKKEEELRKIESKIKKYEKIINA